MTSQTNKTEKTTTGGSKNSSASSDWSIAVVFIVGIVCWTVYNLAVKGLL